MNICIDDKYNEHIDAIDDLLEKKQQEIEEAYQRYLGDNEENNNSNPDAGNSMVISDYWR